MQSYIQETDSDKMVAYFKARKSGTGNKVSDVYRVTEPGREAPLNYYEHPRAAVVHFFDEKGEAVVSATPNEKIALMEVHCAYPPCVWVRAGHEKLLEEPQWKNMLRIRAVH